MKTTQEKKAAVKNGVLRMILVVASMVIGVLILFLLIIFAGQKAGWIYTLIHFIGLFLVLGIYASYADRHEQRQLQDAQEIRGHR